MMDFDDVMAGHIFISALLESLRHNIALIISLES
jgi:hypothetical protein